MKKLLILFILFYSCGEAVISTETEIVVDKVDSDSGYYVAFESGKYSKISYGIFANIEKGDTLEITKNNMITYITLSSDLVKIKKLGL